MASGVLPGTGRDYPIDVEDSEPLYVQCLFHFTKGCRPSIDRAATFGPGDAERIYPAPGIPCPSFKCDSRNSLQLARWRFLCLSQCLGVAGKIPRPHPL